MSDGVVPPQLARTPMVRREAKQRMVFFIRFLSFLDNPQKAKKARLTFKYQRLVRSAKVTALA